MLLVPAVSAKMAKISSPLIREGPELNNEALEDISDTEAPNASTNSSPPQDDSMQPGKKSLKGPMHGSDMGSPILEDGLPGYDNWARPTDADLENDPFCPLELGRSRLSADWRNILQEGNKRYPLRDTDRNTFRGSAWHDTDKSGNFDPDQKPERFTRPQRVRIRKTGKVCDLGEDDYDNQTPKLHQPRTLSYEQGRKNGRRMIIQLSFSPKKGIEKFKALTREFSPPEADDEVPHGHRRSFSDSAFGGSKSPFKDRNRVTARRSAHNLNEKILDQ
jgi:hypothetical protein